MLLPQVPEQKNVYIGIYHGSDFDMYLYEYLGFTFLERDIGTEDFLKRHKHCIGKYIKHLILLRDGCDRVIKKLEANI